MRKLAVFFALSMAAVVVLMAALAAPDAEARKKKKKKHRPPAYNVVQCQPYAESCDGTPVNDYLLGSSSSDDIHGQEGNDIYAGNGGDGDYYLDSSATSNDFYTGFPNSGFPHDEFNSVVIDSRGSSDTIDLRNFKSTDFAFYASDLDLQIQEITGTKSDVVYVYNHFGATGSGSKGAGHIERILFSDRTVSGDDLLGINP